MFLTERDERILEAMRESGNFECPDANRAGGDVTCRRCGYLFSDHPRHIPFNFLTVLCDGSVVKL